ncbi:MAG: hypothetical protein KAG14_04350, partial [Mycoplasmataceae bacterium]|nr:hypothetical protein [Mycoplasmataceae bacterium]
SERRRKDKKILAILNEKFSSSNISHAYIYDKNWITNVSSHSKTLFNPKNERRIVLKTDVKSFFDNIDWEILKTKLHKIGAYREGMPESTLPGLVLSPIYSNIYMHEFDMRMEKFCKDNNLMISRYSDDIFVTTTHKTPKNFEMSEALAHIKTLLKELKLEINDKKTKIVNLAHESIKITGIMVNNNYLSLPKRHSDMIAAWYRKPHKYGLTIKYIDNYIKELNKRKIRFRIKQ